MNVAPPKSSAGLALGVWLVSGLLAAGLATVHPALGLATAGVGGLVFGLLSARRVQGRRVSRRRPAAPGEGGS